MPENKTAPWLTALVEHDGFPMGLRVRPSADSDSNLARLTRRLVVTHHLEHVKPNGLPESEYNQSLAQFDDRVHELIEAEGKGLVVLVETFAGRRIYYCYVEPSATFKVRYGELKKGYPQHNLEIGFNEEPDWSTYALYHRLFPW
jgi:hypothetical protein